MVAPEEALGTTAASARPPSDYADHMPKLHRFAALPAGDPQRSMLREELILAFVPVVENLGRRHAHIRLASAEELTQVGMVGLILAIDRWDPERSGGDFLSYLIPCVRGEMLRWFRDRTWSMRVPRRLKDLSVAIGRVSGPLSQELGRAPRPSELADRLGAGREEVIEGAGRQGQLPYKRIECARSENRQSLRGAPRRARCGAGEGRIP